MSLRETFFKFETVWINICKILCWDSTDDAGNKTDIFPIQGKDWFISIEVSS